MELHHRVEIYFFFFLKLRIKIFFKFLLLSVGVKFANHAHPCIYSDVRWKKNSKAALSFIKCVVLEVSSELEWQDWELSLPKNVWRSDNDCNGL